MSKLIIQMGVYLQKVAVYCDCLQTPWTIPTTTAIQANDSEANLKNQTMNSFHQQNLITDALDNGLEKEEEKQKKNCQTSQTISCSEKFEEKNREEMEIIDLQKILPAIVKQSYEKAKQKKKEKEDESEESRIEIEEKQKEESSGRLSNVFEHRKYLIEEDEAEFYKVGWN